jgi:hypothetical protein
MIFKIFEIKYQKQNFKNNLLKYFLLLDQKKVTKKNQEIAKAIAINCDRQTKAKMSPGLQHFLTLLLDFAAPISLKLFSKYKKVTK